MTAMQRGTQETLRPLDLTAANGKEANFKTAAAAEQRTPAQKISAGLDAAIERVRRITVANAQTEHSGDK